MEKKTNSFELLECIKLRFSPKNFSNKEVSQLIVKSCLEAARTAPSSYNEQPWKFIVGFKGDAIYNKIASTLGESNAIWATSAPVLICGLTNTKLKRNGKDNTKAQYDLGQSVAYLTLQAMSLNVYVHQMGGFNAIKLHEIFDLDEHLIPLITIALGYVGDDEQKTVKDRSRKEFTEIIISERDF